MANEGVLARPMQSTLHDGITEVASRVLAMPPVHFTPRLVFDGDHDAVTTTIRQEKSKMATCLDHNTVL